MSKSASHKARYNKELGTSESLNMKYLEVNNIQMEEPNKGQAKHKPEEAVFCTMKI